MLITFVGMYAETSPSSVSNDRQSAVSEPAAARRPSRDPSHPGSVLRSWLGLMQIHRVSPRPGRKTLPGLSPGTAAVRWGHLALLTPQWSAVVRGVGAARQTMTYFFRPVLPSVSRSREVAIETRSPRVSFATREGRRTSSDKPAGTPAGLLRKVVIQRKSVSLPSSYNEVLGPSRSRSNGA